MPQKGGNTYTMAVTFAGRDKCVRCSFPKGRRRANRDLCKPCAEELEQRRNRLQELGT